MQTVQITSEVNQAIQTTFAGNKWAIVKEGQLQGTFGSRSNARLANKNYQGAIVPTSELKFKIVDPAPVAPAAKTLLPNAAEILAKHGCPYCGDTSNGCTYDDAPGHETDYLFCHVCLTSFHSQTGALRGKGKKIEMTRFSTIERPCKQVWHIADAMAEKVGGFKNLRRKDVLAHCVASGIAFYTARTQYQLWLTIQNGGTI